jgi:hypothetical protein
MKKMGDEMQHVTRYYTDDGKMMLKTEAATYRIIHDFNDKNVAVVVTKDWDVGVINTDGEIIVAFGKYAEIDKFSYEYARVVESNDRSITARYGIINTKGEVIIKPEYDYIYDINFYCGLAIVNKDGKYGVVNMNGEIVINPEYDKIICLDDGYIRGIKDNQESVLSTVGEVMIRPGTYDEIGSFLGGIALAQKNDKYYIINTRGEIIKASETKYE